MDAREHPTHPSEVFQKGPLRKALKGAAAHPFSLNMNTLNDRETLVPGSYVEANSEAWLAVEEGRPTLAPTSQQQMTLELESLGLEVE